MASRRSSSRSAVFMAVWYMTNRSSSGTTNCRAMRR
jgi:hypothetical protein